MAGKQTAGQGGAPGAMSEAAIQVAQAQAEPLPMPQAVPGAIPVTDAEALQFIYDGRQRLTALGVALRNLREWSEVFELRGGAVVYGDDALAMVYLYNAMDEFATDERMAIFRRLRTDI